MKNYRPVSGDGSAKAVLSDESISPLTTAPRREPPPCNSPSTPALRTSVHSGGSPHEHPPSLATLQNVDSTPNAEGGLVQSFKGDNGSLRPSFDPCYAAISRISSRNKKTRLPPKYPKNVDCPVSRLLRSQLAIFHSKKPVSSPKFTFQHWPNPPFSSCRAFVRSHQKFQKKLVFARPPFAKRTSKPGHHYRGGLGKPIRGLFLSPHAPVKVDFPPSSSVRYAQLQNVDKHLFQDRITAFHRLPPLNFENGLQPLKRFSGNETENACIKHLQRISLKQSKFTETSSAIFHENVDSRDFADSEFPPRHFSFKKARESAKVNVSLTTLPAQKVDLLASRLLGYWLLAIGYFPLGTSHLISPKTPAIPEFSPNPTCPSHQKVDCFPGPLAFGSNFSQIEGRSREPFRG
jgi:hypothetical protein